MTTRTILFDSPFLLGFDHTRALIDRAAKAAAESYPPYNVEQRGESAVRITLAVAGFTPDAPRPSEISLSAMISLTISAGSGCPTPQQCDRIRFFCSVSTSFASILTLASFPKPVLMP